MSRKKTFAAGVTVLLLALLLPVCSSGEARENMPSRPVTKDNFDVDVPSVRDPESGRVSLPDDPSAHGPEEPDDESRYERPAGHNLQLCVISPEQSGSRERRCYYRIFSGSNELGRTSIGPESRLKCFEAMLRPGRHQLTLEKYVLNETEGRYLKVNNIEQPRPASVTVEIPNNRVIDIRVEHSNRGSAADYRIRTLRR
jgi:hypothetical protein